MIKGTDAGAAEGEIAAWRRVEEGARIGMLRRCVDAVRGADAVKRGASGLCDWCGAAARLGSMFTFWPQFQSHNPGGVGYLIEGTHAQSAFPPQLRRC